MVATVSMYDTTTKTWNYTGQLSVARDDLGSAAVAGSAYFAGGTNEYIPLFSC